ncbi:hypothetical protein ACIQKB_35990 [Streptomyces sp. NPDC092046]|uniref:hypothetical protein n=1 Tax=Streptomyces sp. NPDC092046 TaxID=3366009 RepID=UPI00382644FF
MSQDLNAELSRQYETCIEQVRTIAALDPAKGAVDWDQYTCTSANEFALDVAMAWAGAHPQHEALDAYRAIMDGVPVELESVHRSATRTRHITYGLTSFGRVLQCIEAMLVGRFEPHTPGGIIPDQD